MNLVLSQFLSFVLSGRHAGEPGLACNDPVLAQLPRTLNLRSSDFADRCEMPIDLAGKGVGANLSPELHWDRLPGPASHWLLVVEDPDAPTPRPFVHCLASGPAELCALPKGCLIDGRAPRSVAFGRNSGRGSGYGGPRPLPGHGVHRYVFQLFALEVAPTEAQMLAGVRGVMPQLRSHAIASGGLHGTFQRDWGGRPVSAQGNRKFVP